MHRTVVVQTGSIRNRRYMEMLTFLALPFSVVLILVSAVFWLQNPGFFVASGIVWIAGCLYVTMRFRRLSRDAQHTDSAIPLPDMAELAAVTAASRRAAHTQAPPPTEAAAKAKPGNVVNLPPSAKNKHPATRRSRRDERSKVSGIRAAQIAKNIRVYSPDSKSSPSAPANTESAREGLGGAATVPQQKS